MSTDTAILDSGTTKIILPKNDLNSLMEAFKVLFGIQCDLEKRSSSVGILTLICNESDLSKYPSFEFSLGSDESERIDFELTPEEYVDKCFYTL